ncbi:hypothetical protein BC940DRAFT_311270 [Gongronella butleri]|nr:hypothetical protein BC940DRAFT_311270 [Gongronella butleri]
MDKTFAGLFRHSRLASYDRTLAQVYTTPKSAKKTGNWGLKRSLPTVVRTGYVTVGDLDTSEHQTPWQSGESQVLFVKRWKELFPGSKAPLPRRDQVQHNVASMTPQQFKRFLKQARQQAPAFQQALKNKEVTPEQVFDFLHCHFNKDLTLNEQDSVVGPTYSNYEVEYTHPVKGRILNKQHDGYAVGIQGIVAKLSKTTAAGLRVGTDRGVRDFFVQDARIDPQGRPEVTVNLQAQPSDFNNLFPTSYAATPTTTVSDIFSSTRPTYASAPNATNKQTYNQHDDNIQQNPDHLAVMMRITDLLKKPNKSDNDK